MANIEGNWRPVAMVYQLEDALHGVTEETRLRHPLRVRYVLIDGEGFIEVEKDQSVQAWE